MTEEIKAEEVKVEEAEVVVEQAPELSETEVQASEQGWVPKEEWVAGGGNADEWRTAKEFVDRGELYKTIHSTKRDLKQTQAALTALQRHHQFVFEKAQKEAIEELKREKRLAIRDEDFARLEAVEEEIEKTQEQQAVERKALQQEQLTAQQINPHPEFIAWVDRNNWYTQNSDMREEADAFGLVYMQRNPGVASQDVLKYVEGKIKKTYPEKFAARKAAPNAVAAVSRVGSPSRKAADDFQMTETEREIMNDLVKSEVMTKEAYVAELKKAYKRG